MKFVIDRFEGEWAVMEDENKEIYKFSASAFKNFKEGDVVIISRDENETNKRKERIKSLSEELFE